MPLFWPCVPAAMTLSKHHSSSWGNGQLGALSSSGPFQAPNLLVLGGDQELFLSSILLYCSPLSNGNGFYNLRIRVLNLVSQVFFSIIKFGDYSKTVDFSNLLDHISALWLIFGAWLILEKKYFFEVLTVNSFLKKLYAHLYILLSSLSQLIKLFSS